MESEPFDNQLTRAGNRIAGRFETARAPKARSGRYFHLFGRVHIRFSGSVTFFVVSQTSIRFACRRMHETRVSAGAAR
ncbi:hypothetical protein, partial [Burkholderia cepacia]|uniref:hypothetical protein n=3 Tax=Burkholderia TaxID=32008 RepID=UPI001C2D5527